MCNIFRVYLKNKSKIFIQEYYLFKKKRTRGGKRVQIILEKRF